MPAVSLSVIENFFIYVIYLSLSFILFTILSMMLPISSVMKNTASARGGKN